MLPLTDDNGNEVSDDDFPVNVLLRACCNQEVRLGNQKLFNVFNHANLAQPNATVDSPTAGQIFALQGLAQMRKWQFGLLVQF